MDIRQYQIVVVRLPVGFSSDEVLNSKLVENNQKRNIPNCLITLIYRFHYYLTHTLIYIEDSNNCVLTSTTKACTHI